MLPKFEGAAAVVVAGPELKKSNGSAAGIGVLAAGVLVL